MATSTSALAPTLAFQTEALCSFLFSADQTLPRSSIEEICTSLDLNNYSDFKEKAKILRFELALAGIKLGHSHALEALSRMVGFPNYMRALESIKQQSGDFQREGFLLRIKITGSDDPQFTPYESLPLAGNALIEQVMALLNIPGEPVFCDLCRTPKSVVIEVCRAVGPWFTVELLGFEIVSDKLNFVEFDGESQRIFLERILRALERGKPGTLVEYGVIPHNQVPWSYASFRMTFDSTGVEKFIQSERDLFLMLDVMGFQSAYLVDSKCRIVGSQGICNLEMNWIRFDGEHRGPIFSLSANVLKGLIDRFHNWRRGLAVSVKDACLLIVAGTTDADTFQINHEMVRSEREQQNLSQLTLASQIGLTEQAIQRVEKYGFVQSKIISLIAKALKIDPSLLVDKPEGDLGFEVTEPLHLLNTMKKAHQYSLSYPDDLDSEKISFIKNTLEVLTELADMVQIGEGVGVNTFNLQPIREDILLEDSERILGEIHEMGLILIVSRSVRFNKRFRGMEETPLETLTFRFQPIATASSIAVRG